MQLRNQRGFTLIEIAIVLTIVGLVIGGIWLAAATVMNNNKTAELSRQVIQIVQNTKNLFANQTGANPAAGFNNAVAIAAGVFPGGMVINNATVKHPFATVATNSVAVAGAGNQVTLTVGAATATAGAGVAGAATIGLPQSACVDLISRVATQENFTRYGISAVFGNAAPVVAGASVATITGACASTTATNAVTIVFIVP